MGPRPPKLARRQVMVTGAATVGALAAAAALLPAAPKLPAEPAAPTAGPATGGGYRASDHVLRYYQTTRI